jgi:RNA polymerase sigma-70 factor (ECF subfamily)
MISSRLPQSPIVVPVGLSEREPAPTFRDIFEREYGYVRHVARRMGIRERELDDLVADVFLTVHRKLDEFQQGFPLRPWLFGITFRVVVGTKRRFGYSREQLSDALPNDSADSGPGADEQMETEERRRMVHEALLELDVGKRAVFILHELDEVPMADIATVLDVPTNTAYSRLRLARKEFRVALERVVSRSSRTRMRGAS